MDRDIPQVADTEDVDFNDVVISITLSWRRSWRKDGLKHRVITSGRRE